MAPTKTQRRKVPVTPSSPYPFDVVQTNEKAPARFTAFVYGYSGAGKTYMLRSLLEHEDLFPVLVAVCDRGELSLKDVTDSKKMVVSVADLDVLTSIYHYLCDKAHPFKTLVIDNVTQLHRSAIMAQAEKASSGKSREAHEFTQQDYGVARNQILAVAANFVLEPKLAGMNVIMTALADQRVNEATEAIFHMPHLPGKLATEIPSYFDLVGYLHTVSPTNADVRAARKAKRPEPTPTRILQTAPTSSIPMARIRGGAFTDMPEPTYPKIYQAITA